MEPASLLGVGAWGLLSGLFSGGASLLGSSMASASSDRAAELAYQSQQETNELNYRMFRQNQQWQERMANTAHQREVQDLRDAGLNPILSATGGSGAATPNLASPTATSPGSPVADKAAIYMGMANALTESISSATDAAKKLADLDLTLEKSRQTKKVTDVEVGTRNVTSWALNNAAKGSGDIASFAKSAGGLISDLYGALKSQFNVLQMQNRYNTSRGLNRPQSQLERLNDSFGGFGL